MFQTFSGSSRRPRQVNLSGRNTNPFAANSWSPVGSGTEKSVANAQQERQQRQQERERLIATKQIQRVWRGHRTRTALANTRRRAWDETSKRWNQSQSDTPLLLHELRLLLSFFSPSQRDDVRRLNMLGTKIMESGPQMALGSQQARPLLGKLTSILLAAVQTPSKDQPSLLEILVSVIQIDPRVLVPMSDDYYTFLSSIAFDDSVDRGLFNAAVGYPLAKSVTFDRDNDTFLRIYGTFATNFLITPNLSQAIGLRELARFIEPRMLSVAMLQTSGSSTSERLSSRSRLWLLAHFIALHRFQQLDSHDLNFLRALSLHLSNSSGEIVGRMDVANPGSLSSSTDDNDSNNAEPLPAFIREELASLVNKASITKLLTEFNTGYARASITARQDASFLASYALTLLRIFPRRNDEIRMWFYLGNMTVSSGESVPALRFFWQAMSLTNTFAAIRADPAAALSLLRLRKQSLNTDPSPDELATDREWRLILLFLELYIFVLRYMDDEEFLSAASDGFAENDEPLSRIRRSALPLEDVKHLTIFLKHLAFATYYNKAELTEVVDQPAEGGLGSLFVPGVAPFRFPASKAFVPSKDVEFRPFAGIAGMTISYVRTIVTGVMRMLYERDSRRRYLPNDHWLMTSQFDMEGFIPAVVMEEERQHAVTEDEVEDDELNTSDEPISRDHELIGTSMSRRAQMIESMKIRQQELARQKMLAVVAPRLEILQNMPFVIPFETRVQIFRHFVQLDQTRRRGGNADPDIWRMSMVQQAAPLGTTPGREVLSRHHAKIRRDSIFQDAYTQFYQLGDGLKEPIQITFVDQFDTVEAGIDGGGVTKEFLTSVTTEAFHSNSSPTLFVTNEQNLLYPNPTIVYEYREILQQAGFDSSSKEWRDYNADLLRQYEFLGRIMGKCLYEGILVDISFAGFFLLKWAATTESPYRPNINDLRDLDESLYQGLLKLKSHPGDVSDLALDFTITDSISLPNSTITKTITRDLMANGSSITVTNENRPLYVSYVARHRLLVQPYAQTQAFLRGLGQIINPSWLSMFNQSELQNLLSGTSQEIDVEDLRRNTSYGGVYVVGDDGLEHHTIRTFWQVMRSIGDEERRKVLKYVTSSPRAPLLGFGQLNPRFSIRDAGRDESRLPSTSTCVNLLKLPMYATEQTLKEKLLYAVNSGAGFDLS